ncbi:hypothetical protein SAV31267_092110 [Streptomyces avermitilis]|uniref:Uncharacterized protein n=1 Tax=Streptomyces avermitilis TaxID=33903 RepID=A0A4D4N7B9_STRAX|nr:hypothetical protein SAV31267_092110 [Streptomyces avermitilis]
MPHGCSARGDAHGAAVPVDKVPETTQGQIQTGDAVRGGIAQDAPRVCGQDASWLALHEAHAGLSLQPLHMLAHR